ncbi:FAD-dependent oxidoreductase [Cryptosporangium sp. NPDC051539]|uniref:FAD-dependent oxidoreductase n=1 Tax=Cryptosporangium sp. NPDC051539 TaxID=3363962 RepID=UPI0037B45EAB
MSEFDVAIVGAGPAGSATARRLALAGCRVVLVERSRFGTPRVGESLSPSVTPLLAALGVRESFANLAPQESYGVRSSWGGRGESSSSTMVDPHGPGWYVDRAAFDRMLAAAAAAAGASLRLGVVCREVEPGWVVRLSTGEPVSARVLVDATGRAARLGRRRDAERIAFDRLVAVTGFAPDPAPGGFGLVETVPEGWWYSAPAGASRLVTMLLTDADLSRDRRLTVRDRWLARLGSRTAARLTAEVGTLRVVPARSQRLHRREVAAPWIAVGDAAFAVDPITGDGVAKALRGAETAAGAVLALLDGDAGPLAAYEAALDRECTHYLRRRLDFYAAEARWPEAPFWNRRRSVRAAL